MFKYIKFISLLSLLSAKNLKISSFKPSKPDVNLCRTASWVDWVKQLDCFWQKVSDQWWYTGKVGHASGTSEWKAWDQDEQNRLQNNIDNFYMKYYYEVTHQKVCVPDGVVSVSKVTADTIVANCSDPSLSIDKFSVVRHHDATLSIGTTTTNFASIYNDKAKQSHQEAEDAGHPEWIMGDFVNYDHLPAKSIYSSDCNGGDGGKRLPTVAIMAIDHKGPVWSYCTTSRSISSDNARLTMALMQQYIANNQYGRAILENFDCLLEGAIKYQMPETFTDYKFGFNNLVYLHYEAGDINENERDILIQYLEAAMADPEDVNGNTNYWDMQLEAADTYMKPAYC